MVIGKEKCRVAVFTSHPIQYQAPLFRKMAAQLDIDLTVFFFWDAGAQRTYDEGFGREVQWDIPLLEGYRHEFLRNIARHPASSHFWGEVNPSLVAHIGRGSCDAVLVLGWQTFSQWLAILTARVRRIPVFVRGENPLNQELRKSAWKRGVKQVIMRALFRCVSGFLYIGGENRKFYRHYGAPEEKLFFAPYAVHNEWFQAEAQRWAKERTNSRRKLGIGEKDCTFLFVGKLSHKKRPMDLLRAFEALKGSASLVFVGDGVLRPELEKYAREHHMKSVHLVGFKNQTELPQYYALADVFVLPSGVGETWGLVVNEAMCFGLPVVVSDVVGCASDLVKNGENGLTFSPGDIAALAAHLSALATDAEKRRVWGGRSRAMVGAYSYERDIKGIRSALARSVGEEHP
jgi:glycosyltransferase involved in cell wall biosynthesis